MRSTLLVIFALVLTLGCQDKKDTPPPSPGTGAPTPPKGESVPSTPGTPKTDPSAEVSGAIKGMAF